MAGISRTPVGPTTHFHCFQNFTCELGLECEAKRRQSSAGKSHRLGALEQLCSYHGPQDSLPLPLTPQGFPEGKQET